MTVAELEEEVHIQSSNCDTLFSTNMTVVCNDFRETQYCRYGDSCHFSHQIKSRLPSKAKVLRHQLNENAKNVDEREEESTIDYGRVSIESHQSDVESTLEVEQEGKKEIEMISSSIKKELSRHEENHHDLKSESELNQSDVKDEKIIVQLESESKLYSERMDIDEPENEKMNPEDKGDLKNNGFLRKIIKTSLCKAFERTGSCINGENCTYAHSSDEIGTIVMSQKPFKKFQMCKVFAENGKCAFGSACRFAHSPSELTEAFAEKPGPGYICHSCNEPGHWLRNCPRKNEHSHHYVDKHDEYVY